MTSRKKIVQFLKTPFYLALYTLTGACLVLALAWVDLAVAQSRLSVISVVVQKVSVTPRLGFAQASVTLTVGDAVGNPALSDQPASKGAITYRSSDDAIARVAADGTVTAVAAGSATISATQAADLPGFEA
ncbi:Ig-like domain-containing protein, partial [Achromobacter dolens]|uniref:Ig-like domain-containing protein n=3 Tax=Achromobacter dolens TaxID=1287738 RepID=UPI003B9ED063